MDDRVPHRQVMLLAPARLIGVCALAALLLATFLFATRGLNLAVDLAGGMVVDVRAPAGLSLVEDALAEAGVDDAEFENINGQPSGVSIIVPQREDLLAPPSAALLAQRLASALKQRHIEVDGIEIIAPSVGRELLRYGAIPPILALAVAVIVSAIRHGRRYALSAVLVILGAMVIVSGLVFSAYLVFQWKFSLISLLTVDSLAILAAVIGAVNLPRIR